MDPSIDSKEDVPVLTDGFIKFSQAFVTSSQKALTMAKIIVDKWFFIFSVPPHIYSDKGWSFNNDILEYLYTLYMVKQSPTTPYNPCGNSICERFNCMFHDLLKTFDKEQKPNWSLHLPSFGFSYNDMSHSVTCYWSY